MNPQLLKNNYIILRNFIASERALQLAEEFKHYAKSHNFKGDHQVPNSHSVYNYLPFLRLVVEKVDEVSTISGEAVFPVCAYSRIYRNNNILLRHKDRPGCEISLTLNLSKDHAWPIWLKTPLDEEISIELEPGDAIIYLGNIAEHWREHFEGHECIQMFMHYVNANGPHTAEHTEFKNFIANNPL
jgi:hypothetical protein